MPAPPRRLGHLLPRVAVFVALLALAGAVGTASVGVAADPGALTNKIDQSKAREDAIRSGVQADEQKIGSFQGRIDELRSHLDEIQGDLDGKQAQLTDSQTKLRAARSKLVRLRAQVKRDQATLAEQLVGVYESAPPDMVHVLINAKGFVDLLEQVDQLKLIGRQNASIVARLRAAKTAVSQQAASLADLAQRQRALVVTATAQRDAVAQVKLQVVEQQLQFVRSRDRKSSQLASLRDHRNQLEKELVKVQDQQAGIMRFTGSAAEGNAAGYGFFAASGTNYTVGDEPELSRKLNQLGLTLHLHLIGLSGYRSPQHSIEVGGFPNDPHTKGQASDTTGVESVDESTLRRFGFTRPFAGAAEADHIQLVGSI